MLTRSDKGQQGMVNKRTRMIDLHIMETGLNTYLRLKDTLEAEWFSNNHNLHLNYWDTLKSTAADLWQGDDRCSNTQLWERQVHVNLDSFQGGKKHITPSEVTIYTCLLYTSPSPRD